MKSSSQNVGISVNASGVRPPHFRGWNPTGSPPASEVTMIRSRSLWLRLFALVILVAHAGPVLADVPSPFGGPRPRPPQYGGDFPNPTPQPAPTPTPQPQPPLPPIPPPDDLAPTPSPTPQPPLPAPIPSPMPPAPIPSPAPEPPANGPLPPFLQPTPQTLKQPDSVRGNAPRAGLFRSCGSGAGLGLAGIGLSWGMLWLGTRFVGRVSRTAKK